MQLRLGRVFALAICGAGLAGPAAQAQSLPTALTNCLAVSGAVERLACYDRIARGVAGQAAVPRPASVAPAYPAPVFTAPANAPPAYSPPPLAVTPQAQFGAEKMEQAQASPQRLNMLISPVTDYRMNGEGKFTLTLANGQVWKQLDGDALMQMPKSHQVKITHGFFGSYNLVFIGSNVSFKVTRLK